jgi:hypothetical protein
MSGNIPPLHNTPSWRGAQLKMGTATALPFCLIEGFVVGAKSKKFVLHRIGHIFVKNVSEHCNASDTLKFISKRIETKKCNLIS